MPQQFTQQVSGRNVSKNEENIPKKLFKNILKIKKFPKKLSLKNFPQKTQEKKLKKLFSQSFFEKLSSQKLAKNSSLQNFFYEIPPQKLDKFFSQNFHKNQTSKISQISSKLLKFPKFLQNFSKFFLFKLYPKQTNFSKNSFPRKSPFQKTPNLINLTSFSPNHSNNLPKTLITPENPQQRRNANPC
jgi:hypothetical protein